MIDERRVLFGLLAGCALVLAGCPGDRAEADWDDEPAAVSSSSTIGKPLPGVPLIFPAMFACKAVRNDATADASQYPTPPPPFSPGIYPCTRCHDKPDDYNATPRTLTLQHTNIKLDHGPREQWCYDCHNPTDRDKLRLAGGRLVPFEQSYLLCGQCHGEKLRDWRLGVHGRRTGCWNGQREYLLCVSCHNQHSPHFAPIVPEPRPHTPDEIQLPDHGGEP